MRNKRCIGASRRRPEQCFSSTSTPIVGCLGCLKRPEMFSVIAPRSSRVSFNRFLPLSKSTCIGKQTSTQARKSERQNMICLSVSVPDKELSWQVRVSLCGEGGRGASAHLHAHSMPSFLLFANHTLWNSHKWVRRGTLGVCQLPSQQLAISNSVRFSRKQLSLSICLAVTFPTHTMRLVHAGLS